MTRQHTSWKTALLVQVVVLAGFAVAFARMNPTERTQLEIAVTRKPVYTTIVVPNNEPLTVTPLYNEPSVVSDEELAAVLQKVRPRFPLKHRKPNHVEHALRAWGVEAKFRDPACMSGEELRDFLIDHSRYAASWRGEHEEAVAPILLEEPAGLDVLWSSSSRTSVHHDHLLACLTEAGVSLDLPVYPPSGRDSTIDSLLQESLRNFRLDERETEWSALTYALWMPPTKEWRNLRGRVISFDLLAQRLMRGARELGVCSGTHRVYSLMVMWRIDHEQHDVLSDEVAAQVWQHLQGVRDVICESQFEDGRWPSNWPDGKNAVESPDPYDVEYRQVIATGHHLEWLAIAPLELHPPRERVLKAARWLIDNTTSKSDEYIMEKYTFYSHVGNALALWRQTHPAPFWMEWERTHPEPATPAIAE